MKYEIEEELINKIANYLVTKPYKEVAQILDEINKNIKPIPENEKTEKSD